MAVIQEEKLFPLYGRGKTHTDPRSRSIPGMSIPNHRAGQRPETAHPHDPNHFPHPGFGFMGGLVPMTTARFGNFTFSADFGSLFLSLLNFHVHGFPDATTYGAAAGFLYGFANPYHGVYGHRFHQPSPQGQQAEILKYAFLMFSILASIAPLVVVPCGS